MTAEPPMRVFLRIAAGELVIVRGNSSRTAHYCRAGVKDGPGEKYVCFCGENIPVRLALKFDRALNGAIQPGWFAGTTGWRANGPEMCSECERIERKQEEDNASHD